MAHINSIGAGLYAELGVNATTTAGASGSVTALASALTRASTGFTASQSNPTAGWLDPGNASETARSGFAAVANVRELPAVGTPANVVNVPRYGSTTTLQISGQADAPTLEFTFNYVPGEATQRLLQADVGSATVRTFVVRLSNSDASLTRRAALGATVQFSDFVFNATVSSFLVTPSLTDANQATMSLAVATDIDGPLTSS